MTLLETWRKKAYDQNADQRTLQMFWGTYFNLEKEIYQKLLKTPDEPVKGTVKELAEKFNIDLMSMVGFLDGINDSLKVANPIETMDENTEVNLDYDMETIFGEHVDGDFCVTARGDSMINARIFDGDIITVKRQSVVEDGEIAAVAIGDEATLKRVYYIDNGIMLVAENPAYKPMVFIGEDCANVVILGKAVSMQTRLN